MVGKNCLENSLEFQDFSTGGTCSKCLQCCTDFIPLTQEEVNRIKEYIKVHNIPRAIARSDSGDLMLLCPFISDDGCSIYPVRPKICRGFCCWKPTQANLSNKNKCLTRAIYNGDGHNFVSLHDIFYGENDSDRTYTNYLFELMIKNKGKR